MSGTITKQFIQTAYTYPGTAGSPGDPGSPALPAGYRQVTKTISAGGLTPTGRKIQQAGPFGISLVDEYVYITPRDVTYSELVWFPATPARPPTPAIPAAAPRYVVETNSGWTGGGRSVEVLPASGAFTFRVPTAIGVIVGLVEFDQTTSPSEASHAFYIQRNAVITIRESGVNIYSVSGIVHNGSSVYMIRRRGDLVDYLIDDVVVYTSAARISHAVVLDATLYLAGDSVTLVALTPALYAQVSAQLPLFRAAVSDVPYRFVDAELPRLASSSSTHLVTTVSAQLPFLTGLSADVRYAQVDARLGAFQSDSSYNELVPVYTGVFASLQPFIMAATSFIRPAGDVSGQLPSFIGLSAQSGYATVSEKLLPLRGYAYDLPSDEDAIMFDAVFGFDSVVAQHVLAVSFSSSGAVLSTIDLREAVSVEMNDALTTELSLALQSILTASFQSAINASSTASDSRYTSAGTRNDGATAWVTNLDTGAVSMYAGFDFDRMYELDGKYYGVRDDSTYLLDGDTDAGTPIDAFVAFGKQTFGTSALKRVPSFYAGVSSTGVLLLRVSTGAETYTYSPRRTDALSRAQRYDLGKGLKANYFEFELFNQDGCGFELDTVEFEALPSGRRI